MQFFFWANKFDKKWAVIPQINGRHWWLLKNWCTASPLTPLHSTNNAKHIVRMQRNQGLEQQFNTLIRSQWTRDSNNVKCPWCADDEKGITVYLGAIWPSIFLTQIRYQFSIAKMCKESHFTSIFVQSRHYFFQVFYSMKSRLF